MRISKTAFKVLYVFAGFSGLLALAIILKPIDAAAQFFFPFFLFIFVAGGARTFMGKGVGDHLKRPWWRFTSKPLAGWILGGVFSLAILDDVFNVVTGLSEPLHFLVLAVDLLLAIAYFNSSVRLRLQMLRLKSGAIGPASADSSGETVTVTARQL